MLHDMLRRQSFEFEGKPLWIAALLLCFVGFCAAYIAFRLARDRIASNGVTTMPAWFIQSFGALLLVGIGLVAYEKRDLSFAIEGLSLCAAMLLISRNIARRHKRNQPNQSPEPTPTTVTPPAGQEARQP